MNSKTLMKASRALTDLISVQHSEHYAYLCFRQPHQVLSSAILKGGLLWADGLLNLKVPARLSDCEPAEDTLTRYGAGLGCRGTLVGMMTAASMNSFRLAERTAQGIQIQVLATAGLSNARRAGDCAEYRQMISGPEEAGTINLIMVTNACLTPAALVESLLMITEAKAAALQDTGIVSPVSGGIATGTGTDSVAVVNGFGPEVRYCGKHVLFGELLAQAVIEAVQGAVSWDRAQL